MVGGQLVMTGAEEALAQSHRRGRIGSLMHSAPLEFGKQQVGEFGEAFRLHERHEEKSVDVAVLDPSFDVVGHRGR